MVARTNATRRDVLRGFGSVSIATGVFGLCAPGSASASDLSLSDRIDLLYSNQFHFNRAGQPQITVGLMQGQTKVRLTAPGGLNVLPSGDGGTTIEGGRSFEITLGRAEPAKQSYTVAVEDLKSPTGQRIEQAATRWQQRGIQTHDREVGTVFGVKGRVLDNRRVLLTSGSFSSEAVARAEAKRLKDKFGALGRLHPLVRARASGRVVAHDNDKGVNVRADGVLWFSPRGSEPITVHDVLSGTTMGKGRREDREYWGSIYVAIDRHGKLAVVNLVSETQVLAGLVPAEIYASAPMEALKAQAVAARGQLVTKIGTRHLDDPFLLCSEQHCQVYAGRLREHPRTTKAVAETAGWVAMRPGATQLIDTVYSANCGGHTEHNELVWPSPADPQLRGRADPLVGEAFAAGITEANLKAWLRSAPPAYSRPEGGDARSVYRWTRTIDPAAIAGNPGVPESLGKIERLVVLRRGHSGRALALKLVGARHSVEIHGELRIRRALGGLKSSMFMVLPDADKFGRFQLVGGGHGHGVGLCQHGAMGMARGGKPFGEILAHYYTGAQVLKLW